MGVDKRELDAFIKKLEQLNTLQKHQFMEQVTKDSAGALLTLVIKKTTVGESRQDGDGNLIHVGGALRRAWTCRTEEEARKSAKAPTAIAHAKTLDVEKQGHEYSVEVINPMHYASYVEYGHRQEPGRYVPAIGKRLKKSWVEGQFFLKKAETEFIEAAPTFLQGRLEKFLKKTFK